MTHEEREALVERMANVIGADSPCQMTRDEAMSVAHAALAVAEPVVREDERAQIEDATNRLFTDGGGRNMGEAFAAAIVQRRIRARGDA